MIWIKLNQKIMKKRKKHIKANKTRIDQPGDLEWSQFFIQMLGVNGGHSIIDSSN